MARPKSETKFVRKNVTIPPDLEARLPQLRKLAGAVSDSDLIRQALQSLARSYDLDVPPPRRKKEAPAKAKVEA